MSHRDQATVTIRLEEYLRLRDFQKDIFRAFYISKSCNWKKPAEELLYRDTVDLKLDLGNDAIREVLEMLVMDNREVFNKYKPTEHFTDGESLYVCELAERSPVIVEDSELELELDLETDSELDAIMADIYPYTGEQGLESELDFTAEEIDGLE